MRACTFRTRKQPAAVPDTANTAKTTATVEETTVLNAFHFIGIGFGVLGVRMFKTFLFVHYKEGDNKLERLCPMVFEKVRTMIVLD